MTAHTSFFENVINYVDRAAALTNHPKGLLDQIKHCNSVYHFESNTAITSCPPRVAFATRPKSTKTK
jgi:hypothetical protein